MENKMEIGVLFKKWFRRFISTNSPINSKRFSVKVKLYTINIDTVYKTVAIA